MRTQTPFLRHLGGGHNSHVGLIMDASVYANLSDTAYTRLTEPVPYTKHGAGNIEAAQADTNVIRKEARRVYNLYENIYASLKKEVITEVE